jgi:hypothetical protein
VARSYDVRTTAVAIGADAKWVDNLLSRHDIPGVSSGRQGVVRRISDDGLLAIAIVRALNHDVGVSVHRAVELTAQALGRDGQNPMHVDVTPLMRLVIDRSGIEASIRAQIIHAMETAGQVRRGRPPRRRTAE